MKRLIDLKQGHYSKRRNMIVLAIATTTVLLLTACGGGSNDEAAENPSGDSAVALVEALPAGQWVSNFGAFKDAVNWDMAETVSLDLTAGVITPSNLTLTSGSPYVIEVTNSDSVEHGLSILDFFRSSAVRKIESPGAEVKMRLFKDFTILAGKTISIFVVPVMPGVSSITGLTDGSAVAGMEGTISVTGAVPISPAPVIEDFSTSGELASAEELVANADWTAAATATIDMGDNGAAHFFKQKVTNLKLNQPVILTFNNAGNVLHEFNAEEFFYTCATYKITDAEGSFMGGIIRPADLEAGGVANLYIIPTKAGTYQLTDSTSGMESMHATIVVK